jgi:hypothetical protein
MRCGKRDRLLCRSPTNLVAFPLMPHAASYLIRGASVLAGSMFLYMAMFMYQDEAGELHNRLVNLWVRANVRQQKSFSKRTAIVKAAADVVDSGLKWLFGGNLISARVVAVSYCISIASLGILFSIFWELQGDAVSAGYFLVLGGLHAVFGLFAARMLFNRGRSVMASGLLALLSPLCVLTIVYLDFSTAGSGGDLSSSIGVLELALGGSALGITCDLLLLVANRRMLKTLVRSSADSVLILGMVFNAVWFFIVAETSRFLLFLSSPDPATDPILRFLYAIISAPSGSGVADTLCHVAVFGMSTNLFNLIASCSVLLVLMVVFFHRIFWPSISRVIYALYQWHVFTNRTFQLSVGVALLSFAFPWVDEIVQSLRR